MVMSKPALQVTGSYEKIFASVLVCNRAEFCPV